MDKHRQKRRPNRRTVAPPGRPDRAIPLLIPRFVRADVIRDRDALEVRDPQGGFATPGQRPTPQEELPPETNEPYVLPQTTQGFEVHSRGPGGILVCCVGYNHESNELAAILEVPPAGDPAFGELCEEGTDVLVRFYLRHSDFPSANPDDPSRSEQFNPDILGSIAAGSGVGNVIHVGTVPVRLHDTKTEFTNPEEAGPVYYQARLQLDSLRASGKNAASTVELIIRTISHCSQNNAVATIRCVVVRRTAEYDYEQSKGERLAAEHTILRTDFVGPIALDADIQLPTIGEVTASHAPFGKWGRSEVLPYSAEVHPVHAALMKGGRVMYFAGTEVEIRRMEFSFLWERDYLGLKPLFANWENGERVVTRDKEVRFEVLEGRMWDPLTDTISTIPLPESPVPLLEPYRLRLNAEGGDVVRLFDENETAEWFERIPHTTGVDENDPEYREKGPVRNVPVIRRGPNLTSCGHCLLADGRLLVAGGASTPAFEYRNGVRVPNGSPMIALFDAGTGTWLQVGDATRNGRWQPSCVELGNGSVFIMGGRTDQMDQTLRQLDDDEIDFGRRLLKSRGISAEDASTVRDMYLLRRRENTDIDIYLPDSNSIVNERYKNASYSYDPYRNYEARYPQLFLLPSGLVFSATKTGSTFSETVSQWNPTYSIFEEFQVIDRTPGTRTFNPETNEWELLNEVSLIEQTSAMLPLMPENEYAATIVAAGTSKGEAWFIQPESVGPPVWQRQQLPVQSTRYHGNAVILADGTVALIGGVDFRPIIEPLSVSIPDFGSDDPQYAEEYPNPLLDTYARMDVEVYNPFTDGGFNPMDGEWSISGRLKVPRNYRSVALLIPDGRVWIAGSHPDASSDNPGRLEMELFSPGYLFRGPRPSFAINTERMGYGQTVLLSLRQGWRQKDINIDRIGLIRCSSVTHGFCIDQRYVGLRAKPVDENSTSIEVQAPPDGNIAPPGYYMLFLLSRNTGTPSIAHIVRVG